MPKLKQIEKCKHPNSRKTKAFIKQLKKQTVKNKNKLSTNLKQNVLGEKILWFRDNLDPTIENCTPTNVEQLIEKYLGRFDDELEQIKLKHSIGNRKNRQHASREDIIRLNVKNEREEFENAGIELPDILDKTQLETLRSWNGELRFLQHFKLKRFSKRNLKTESTVKEVTSSKPAKNSMEVD